MNGKDIQHSLYSIMEGTVLTKIISLSLIKNFTGFFYELDTSALH